MRARIIQIGNSQGIRIPKVLLEEARLQGDVELEVQPEGLLIKRAAKPRSTWDAAFKAYADAEDDQMNETRAPSSFQERQWQW